MTRGTLRISFSEQYIFFIGNHIYMCMLWTKSYAIRSLTINRQNKCTIQNIRFCNDSLGTLSESINNSRVRASITHEGHSYLMTRTCTCYFQSYTGKPKRFCWKTVLKRAQTSSISAQSATIRYCYCFTPALTLKISL